MQTVAELRYLLAHTLRGVATIADKHVARSFRQVADALDVPLPPKEPPAPDHGFKEGDSVRCTLNWDGPAIVLGKDEWEDAGGETPWRNACVFVKYCNGKLGCCKPQYYAHIPPRPDEAKLLAEGKKLTGDVRVPKEGEWYVTAGIGAGLVYHAHHDNEPAPHICDGYRWIIERIEPEAKPSLQSTIGALLDEHGPRAVVNGLIRYCFDQSSERAGEWYLLGHELKRVAGDAPVDIAWDSFKTD